MKLEEIFDVAVDRKASDIHLASGEAPRLRIGGELVPLEGVPDLPELLEDVITPEGRARLAAGLAFERTILRGDLAFVAIVFGVGETGLGATFRVLAHSVPPLDVIGEDALPLFRRIVDAPRGLVFVTGPTGSGKWTTACAVVDAINEARAARIFVLESHPVFRFGSKRGMVSHLHIGRDVESYVRALEIALEADIDVVALEDVPTLDALRQALALADAGHLVIANLNAPTAVDAVARLLESAGLEEPALRRALADNLIVVTGQRLVSKHPSGRTPIYEWIANTATVRAALLGGGLREAQESDPECRTIDQAVRDLYFKERITLEQASQFAKDLANEGRRSV